MSGLKLFIPIGKVDEAKRIVYGTLTAEVPDKSGEVFDYASGKPAVQAWSDEIKAASGGKSLGNVRAMHSNAAAGKFTEIVYDDDAKSIQGAAKIVDDDEWEKVREGVYTGFSIGGSYTRRWQDPENPLLFRFTPELTEVSLVDNPCVPVATFEYIKADGSVELRKFHHQSQEDIMDPKNGGTAATPTDEQVALLKAAETAIADGTATDEQKALITKRDADAAAAKPELVKDGKPVKPKKAVIQDNKWIAPSDGSGHATKRDAEIHELHLEKAAELAPGLAAMNELLANSGEDAGAVAKDAAAKGGEAAAESGEDGAVDKAAGGADPEKPADSTKVVKKAAPAAKVKKGLWGIGNLADILANINCFMESAEYEAMHEGDGSTMPDQLKAWLKQGAIILAAYVAEETSELFDGDDDDVVILAMAAELPADQALAVIKLVKPLADPLVKSDSKKETAKGARILALIDALEKAGARHSATDKENILAMHKGAVAAKDAVGKCMDDHIQKMAGFCKALGVDAPAEEDDAGDTKKFAKLVAVNENLSNEVSAMSKVITATNTTVLKAVDEISALRKENSELNTELRESKEEIAKRVDSLERQPVVGKGHVRAVSKSEDNGGKSVESEADYQARLAKMSPAEKSRELMKLAMANPTLIDAHS